MALARSVLLHQENRGGPGIRDPREDDRFRQSGSLLLASLVTLTSGGLLLFVVL